MWLHLHYLTTVSDDRSASQRALSRSYCHAPRQSAPRTQCLFSALRREVPRVGLPSSDGTICRCRIFRPRRCQLHEWPRYYSPGCVIPYDIGGVIAASYMSGLATSHPAVLYPTTLTSPYDIKDPRAAWATLPQAAGYPCDPTFAAYGPYGDRFDTVDSEARRRNATRETTSTLKAWLNEHRKNPYPTKGEKIMLAIITKMTLTQVSTWFANARRRLKKENKMTWEPRNKTGDDVDDVSVDEDEEKDDDDQKSTNEDFERKESLIERKESEESTHHETTSTKCNPEHCSDNSSLKGNDNQLIKEPVTELSERRKPEDSVATIEKPKIWSLAQTATSESPPTSRKHSLEHHQQEEFKRMRRIVYPETFHSSDVPQPSPYHRGIPRLHPDSSTESSLSSPPLWRSGDIHPIGHSDKYGRITPLDSSDIVSVSPSSTGSPAMVSSGIDQRNTLSPSMTYNRLLGSRLFHCGDVSSSGLRPNHLDHSHFYTTQANSMPSTLDLRTFHSAFMKTSPFGYPVGFSAPPSHMHQSSPTTTVSKAKSDDGTHSRSDS